MLVRLFFTLNRKTLIQSNATRCAEFKEFSLPTLHSHLLCHQTLSAFPLRKTLPSGDHSAVEPPGPIPNPEVKRRSADGSASLGCARVGRCQALNPDGYTPIGVVFFFPCAFYPLFSLRG